MASSVAADCGTLSGGHEKTAATRVATCWLTMGRLAAFWGAVGAAEQDPRPPAMPPSSSLRGGARHAAAARITASRTALRSSTWWASRRASRPAASALACWRLRSMRDSCSAIASCIATPDWG